MPYIPLVSKFFDRAVLNIYSRVKRFSSSYPGEDGEETKEGGRSGGFSHRSPRETVFVISARATLGWLLSPERAGTAA